jgi:dienelactone hydrolase
VTGIVRRSALALAPPRGADLGVADRAVHPALRAEVRYAPLGRWGPRAALLYSPGWDGRSHDNQALLDALAREGFLVVAVHYPGAEPEPPMNFRSEAAFSESMRRAEGLVRSRARDARAVLDALLGAAAGADPGTDWPAPDPMRIGVLGYSLGGAVAAEAAVLDPRFRAAANLDGWHFGEAAARGVAQPFLLLHDDLPVPTRAELTSPEATVRLVSRLNALELERSMAHLERHGGVHLRLRGTRHDAFADPAGMRWRGLGRRLRSFLRYRDDPRRSIRRIVAAFFRHVLVAPLSHWPEDLACGSRRAVVTTWPNRDDPTDPRGVAAYPAGRC